MNNYKSEILKNICYTELVYGRINKKLNIELSKEKIEELEISIFSVDSMAIRGLSQKYGIEAEIVFVDKNGNNLIKKIDLITSLY